MTDKKDSTDKKDATEKGLDPSHPYYVHPSEGPGLPLLPVKFNIHDNFEAWKRSFIVALEVKNKIGFIDGTFTRPEIKTGSKELPHWKRSDSLVKSWILNSLSQELAETFIYCDTAKDVWDELLQMFGRPNEPRVFQIGKELACIGQNNTDISTYFSKFKKLYDEFTSVNAMPRPNCTCKDDFGKKIETWLQKQKLMNFLWGLDESFTHVRGNILMTSPLPSLNEAYAILLDDERQRGMKGGMHEQGLSLNVTGKGRVPRYIPPSTLNDSRTNVGFRAPLFCSHCKRPGHTIHKCFRIHGFPNQPANMKNTYTKPRNSASNAVLSSGEGGSSDATSLLLPGLNKEQSAQVLGLWESLKTRTPTAATESPTNMAGISLSNTNLVPNVPKIKDQTPWIIDSGSSEHMTFEKETLLNMTRLTQPVSICLPNGNVLHVEFMGNVVLENGIVLSRVLFTPLFKFNLISVKRLQEQTLCDVVFTSNFCILQGPSLRRPLAIGREFRKLYIFDDHFANVTRTDHIMWTMGEDFRYQYANSWFRQMDKFIHYVNLDGRVNALYSTPSIYTDAKHATSESWPLKTDDFFPYADRANAYWTGYFTSRPSFKGYVRVLSGYYLAARQLEFLKGKSSLTSPTEKLADALAIAQHHDAVSGTERQHVSADYTMRLHIGYLAAEKLVSSSLASLSSKVGNSDTSFQQCPLLNISYCPESEKILAKGRSLMVVVYNALGWNREDVIQIPVTVDNVIVRDSNGREVESQLLPITNASLNVRNAHVKAYLGKHPDNTISYWLAFSISIPPLGFSTYVVSAVQTGSSSTMSSTITVQRDGNTPVEIGQGNLKLHFSAEGKLTQYINSRNSVSIAAELSYSYYKGFSGTDQDTQASGAYVFRPNGTVSIPLEGQASLTVLKGPLLDEVHQEVASWIHQITRVYKRKEHAEMEFTIGPIPVDDGIGKEIITQLTTNMKTNGTFYTDSNGRDFIKRIRDYRADWNLEVNQPVAGNYYPINLGIFAQDDNMELSVLVDRAVGGSSIRDGQIELMLHRRLLHDDSRGVGEVLNETVCTLHDCTGLVIKGKYFFRIDRIGEGARWRRTIGQEIYSPLILAFSEQDNEEWMKNKVPVFSGIDSSYSLPDNVAVITLQELDNGKTLLRLAHLYEIGEDKDLSVMTNVELKQLFPNKKISEVTEMSLSANQEKIEMEKKRLLWKVENSYEEVSRGGPIDLANLVVELAPMEIRTFLLDLQYIQTYGV